MRKAILTLGAALAAMLGIGLAAGPAMASTPQHLTGSVALSEIPQYATFGNIGPGGTGSFTYTNFTAADIVSDGVGSLPIGQAIPLDFNLGGTDYNHHLTVDSITPTGQASFNFTGHGSYDADGSYTWTATGSVSGEALTMRLVYTGANAGYSVDASATINPDGTLSGSATSSIGQSFTLSGSGAFQALSYTAGVNSVSIPGDGTASFASAIPAGHVYAGTGFTISVKDGGNPGPGHDTYQQNGYAPFTVVGGNLTVH